MKYSIRFFSVIAFSLMISCNQGVNTNKEAASGTPDATTVAGGQENVKDSTSEKDVVKVSVKDGKVVLNNSATIVSSIPASNGMIYVIDGVLLPPSK